MDVIVSDGRENAVVHMLCDIAEIDNIAILAVGTGVGFGVSHNFVSTVNLILLRTFCWVFVSQLRSYAHCS